jgi:hypothetical protein
MQLYDRPKRRDPRTIFDRIGGFTEQVFAFMPDTTAFLTANSALPSPKVKAAGPAMDAALSFVNAREQFAGKPGGLGYARQRVLGLDDPDMRAAGTEFLNKLQALPEHEQAVIQAYLQGQTALQGDFLSGARRNPGAAYVAGNTDQAAIEQTGLTLEDGQLAVPAEDEQFASRVAAIRAMFPEADLTVADEKVAEQILLDISDSTTDYLYNGSASVRRTVDFLDEEVAGKGLSAFTPKNVLQLIGAGGGVASEVGFGAAGDVARAAGAEGIVKNFREDWQGVEQKIGEQLQPLMTYGLDLENMSPAQIQEVMEERMGAFALVAGFGGGVGAALLGKAGRRLKFTRSVLGTLEDVRVAQAATRTSRRTGLLGTAAEAYRAPVRAVAERFDEAILRFARDPEGFFTGAINGRQGRALLNVLAEAKKAHPDDLDAQVGFVREVYGTQMHAGLTRNMLKAPTPDDAKRVFVDTVTRRDGGAAIIESRRTRLGQIRSRIRILDEELEGVDKQAQAPRIREIEDELFEIDNPERAAQRGEDFLDFNRQAARHGKPLEMDELPNTLRVTDAEGAVDPVWMRFAQQRWDEATQSQINVPTTHLEAARRKPGTSGMSLEALKADIQRNGIKTPIEMAYDPATGRYFVFEGHHRLAAAIELGMDDIPVTWREMFDGDISRRANDALSSKVFEFDRNAPTRSRAAIEEEIRVQQLMADYKRLTGRDYVRRERVPADGTELNAPLSEVDRLADPELWNPETSQTPPPTPARLHRLKNANNTPEENAAIGEGLNQTFDATSDENYGYHWTNADRIERIREQGLKPSVPEDAEIAGGFPSAVYFGTTGEEAWNLLPMKSARDSVVLRVRKDQLDISPSGFGEEFISEADVPPSALEYLDESGQWQPLEGPAPKVGKLTPEEYEFLKADIQANGIHTPLEIDVDPATGKAVMSEGFHRWLIAKELGLQEVPVKLTYAKGVEGNQLQPRPELPEIDGTHVENLMDEAARLRLEAKDLEWEVETTFDDAPMLEYPQQRFVRSVVRQPTTRLQRRVHALVVKRNRILDPAKFVDELPKRPSLFIHGIDGNPADFLDQNTNVLSNYMRRAGVKKEVIQRRLGQLAEVTDQDTFFELVERHIFGEGGDIDRALPLDTPSDLRTQIINLHHKPVDQRTRSLVTRRVESRVGASTVDQPVLGKRSADGELVPLPSAPTEFLNDVALPDVDLLIEATSELRRMVRAAEQRGGAANVAAKAVWKVPRFTQHVATAILKPLVMLVRLPAMGMRIQLEQGLRMVSLGYKPTKGFPDGISILPGGIPVPFTSHRLAADAFGPDGWRLLDPDPTAPGFSGTADNSELGLFLDEVAETAPADIITESTVEFRSGRRTPGKKEWEANRTNIERANADWLDRKIAQLGLNRDRIIAFLQGDGVARAFMEGRMNKQLKASSLYNNIGEDLDGKVITMPASEVAEYVEFPDRLSGAGRTPEQNAEIAASIQERGYDPNYVGPTGQREGNIILEVNPRTGTAIVREKHHRIGAAALEGQDLPVEIKIVDDADQGVSGINIDEVDDELGAFAELSALSPRGSGVGKPIDLRTISDADYAGTDVDLLESATRQWIDARIERMRQITGDDPDFIDAVATGKLISRRNADGAEDSTVLRYNAARKDVAEIGLEINRRMKEGVLVNGTPADRATFAALQQERRIKQATLRDIEADHPSIADGAKRIRIGDKRAFRAEIKDRWESGQWEMPSRLQVARRRGKEDDLGLLGDLEHYANAASGIMYRRFKVLTYADKHGTRGSLFTQAYNRHYKRLIARGYEPDAAEAFASARAGSITRDVMYDLNARTSVQRALKDFFWFAPATQEVLYTWLVKVPSASYWPIGAVALAAKASMLIGALEGLGIIKTDASGEKVIIVPGLSKALDLIPGVETPEYAFGKLSGLNMVTSGGTIGVPGLSIQGNFVLGSAAKRWGGPFKALSDVFQPYGPEASILPQPISFLHEAVFGEAPPWEFLSPEYSKAQWDRTFDMGIQYAYNDLGEQGIYPPKPEDFGEFDKESGTWDLTPENEAAYRQASDEYLHRLFDLGKDYAQGQAWVRLMGSTVMPMSLYSNSTEREAYTKFWNDMVVPEGFGSAGLSERQSNLISSYLEDHPNSLGFATFTTISGEKTKDLPFSESLDDAWYDAFYTGERKTATPEEFALKVMANESRRFYQAKLDKKLHEISPDMDPWELLTSGYERNRALAQYNEEWDRYLFLNPEVDAQLREQSALWADQNDVPIRSFEAERLGETLQLLKQISPMLTGESGIRPQELREVSGQISELYSETGTFGKPNTKTEKSMAWWYENVMSPYIDKTADLYAEADRLTSLGLNASHIYDQIRAVSNEAPPKYKGQTVPSAEEVFFGNRTPQEQEAAKVGWTSRPVTWLSDFQRETVGYDISDSTAQFLNDVAEYDNQFYDYINTNEISPSSLEYEKLQQMRDQALASAAAQVGPEAEKYLALNEAQPFVRMSETGFGKDVATWQNAGGGAQYVIDQLQSQGLSEKGFSEEAVALKTWLYSTIENAREDDAAFDELLTELSYSFPMPGGGYRDGVVLYEAVFFGNFNHQYIPPTLATLGA